MSEANDFIKALFGGTARGDEQPTPGSEPEQTPEATPSEPEQTPEEAHNELITKLMESRSRREATIHASVLGLTPGEERQE